jgi:tRNA pseudouridine55 synthase
VTRPDASPRLPEGLRRGFLLLIDKPEGLTSHDVVERVRRAIALPRIGHSGTLDPMATGLLLLCAGGAARLQGFFTRMDKSYEGVIRLGRATTTYDREGEAVGPERDAAGVRAEDVEAAAAAFRGEFLQTPPPYSAKKVGGRKLYELARKGETVPVAPKRVRVSELSFGAPREGRLPFSISCTSGTYIRSIASELGEKLGCGAHLEVLRRTRVGDFTVADALPLEDFERRADGERLTPPHAVPLSRVPFPFERVRVASLEAWKLRKGQSISIRSPAAREGDWVTLVGPADEMVALGQVTPIGHGGMSMVRPRIVLAG